MIAFLHMLKAGGTTLRRLLEDVYQEGLVTDYDDIPMSNRPQHVLQRRRRYQTLHSQGLNPSPQIVFGHFVLSKYRGLEQCLQFATMFRDPVPRVVSHYFHYLRNIGLERNEILPVGITLEEFARLPKYRDMYLFLLGGLGIDELDYVGITEEFEASVALYFKIFPHELAEEVVKRATDLRLNQASEYVDATDYLHEQGLFNNIHRSQRLNEKMYSRAKARFNTLCRKHGV
ncbi:MAG: hypothetical protein VBE63_00145 [Lamprobacter sp.]|uniref:hypothetical protein n=1 Tax=Lamprobacter sp. TaxID=3100796 RepID=UPI002B2620D4|nr:hypothetical protein [Lamprobacter sp.]MEA3638336.1 hypothetical protein [Lamprobacter sp.]